ncbi:hypothetical protein GCM10009727_72590 [Actinomadura napierensis]|uniref:Uncharacterized protein n=1 Tax=Actinomadura napierensis TaxID=267854 RepID=A0ABN3ACC7_9ACTN
MWQERCAAEQDYVQAPREACVRKQEGAGGDKGAAGDKWAGGL